jgi:hypothetical protein
MQSKNKKYLIIFLWVIYFGFGIVSILHTVEFWSISNQPSYAYILAIVNTVAIVGAIWVSLYNKFFSRLLFGITFLYEVLGNIFYSFHWLNQNQSNSLFGYWCELNKWLFELIWPNMTNESYIRMMEISTSWLQGSIVPILQGITFWIILWMSQDKDTNPTGIPVTEPTPEPDTPKPELAPEPEVTPEIPNVDEPEPEAESSIVPEFIPEVEEKPMDTDAPEDNSEPYEPNSEEQNLDVVNEPDTNSEPSITRITPKRPLYNLIKDDFLSLFKEITTTDDKMSDEINKEWKLKKY